MANVLIIDDEEMLCSVMCEHLKGKGHDVTYALTLGDGLRKGASGAFDIVFLDVGLPDGNGLEALDFLRIPQTDNLAKSPSRTYYSAGEGTPSPAI